jgi:TRAP-type C4-dicarboxylate transport system permease large subunit
VRLLIGRPPQTGEALPVVMKFAVDPVHFGMIMLLNLGIGLCHPPVGAILFVGCAVGRVTWSRSCARSGRFTGQGS